MKINAVVQKGHPTEEQQRTRVTLAEINEVKRRHILENLCYTPEEAGAIFGKSARWAVEKVKDGQLSAVDDGAGRGKHGLRGSNGLRITAASVESFRRQHEISPEKWGRIASFVVNK